MGNYNRITLVGNLTKDPQLHNSESDKTVARTRIAINERRKDKSGKVVEKTVYIDLSFFGRNAEVASEYLRKGSQLLIEGKLDMYEWEDGAVRRQKHSVFVSKFVMLGKPKDAADAQAVAGEQPAVANGVMEEAEPGADVPF